jgi:hypothetical protein
MGFYTEEVRDKRVLTMQLMPFDKNIFTILSSNNPER